MTAVLLYSSSGTVIPSRLAAPSPNATGTLDGSVCAGTGTVIRYSTLAKPILAGWISEREGFGIWGGKRFPEGHHHVGVIYEWQGFGARPVVVDGFCCCFACESFIKELLQMRLPFCAAPVGRPLYAFR